MNLGKVIMCPYLDLFTLILPPIYHFDPYLALFIYIFQYLALFTYIYPHLRYMPYSPYIDILLVRLHRQLF